MQFAIGKRFKHAWNAFLNRDPTDSFYRNLGYTDTIRPDRVRLTRSNERSIVTAIYNRIAIDVSAISFQHVRLDQNGRYLSEEKSNLNRCLTLEANIDQAAPAFFQDLVMSMFDEGCVAIVPVDTTSNPTVSGAYDVQTIRVGKITQWHPSHIRVSLYNEKIGRKEELTLPKNMVAIIENPFYAVMNEPNSTLKRLIRKLNLLDAIDEQSGSGKLDLIIQLPYITKTPAREAQAEKRRLALEQQLFETKYGVGYIDGTEKVTQLNRPVENNLMAQITYLTSMLYSQLGLTESVINGTADEKAMLNYNKQTIEPICSVITCEMKRKFLTNTARSQNQTVIFLRQPFGLVPVIELAEIADKLTRNEILSSNELRAIMGFKPSSDPKADELRNKNLNQSTEDIVEPQKNKEGIEE
jgi:hypothetical protein